MIISLSPDEQILEVGRSAALSGRGLNSNPYPHCLIESYLFDVGFLEVSNILIENNVEAIDLLIREANEGTFGS